VATTVDRWTGRETRALREAARLGIRGFAEHLGVSTRSVSNWEAAGEHLRLRPDSQAILDTALTQFDEGVCARFLSALARIEPAARLGPPLSPTEIPSMTSTSGVIGGDFSAMKAFRCADRRVGGSFLYSAVVSYLQSEVAPRLFNGDDTMSQFFTGAAALTEMAGWTAHDAGYQNDSRKYFLRALDLARLSDDGQLEAHVMASMSHLASHFREPREAISIAQRGRDVLQGVPENREVEARLLAMQARGSATLGESAECVRLLTEAEAALNIDQEGNHSPWVSRFDEASLAIEAARCLHEIGDHTGAQRQAERVISLRQGDRGRSRAFGQLSLSRTLIALGKVDEACDVAGQAMEDTRTLGSFLVHQQLTDFGRLLRDHRAERVVREFLEQLKGAAVERDWLVPKGAATDQHLVGHR
jgi:hypothetical protein